MSNHGNADAQVPNGVTQDASDPDAGSFIWRQGITDLVSVGVASSTGGRAGQDDRSQAFSFVINGAGIADSTIGTNGRYRCTVGAVLDGHHGSIVSDMASSMLPTVLTDAVRRHVADTGDLDGGIERGLQECILQLDTATFDAYRSSSGAMTGGTTLLVMIMVLETGTVFTCNVGDCKAVVSVKGNGEALNECHNPPVLAEKRRFEEAGVDCFMDHIGGSDINVCRTIGDYDLGPPLKWRDESDGFSVAHGPLVCTPAISRRKLDSSDEFIVMASDGVWDYYTPESSIITDVRRHLRRFSIDGNDCTGNRDDACDGCAAWLVDASLARQRDMLHEGTPGDNVTVMFFQLRLLPRIPVASGSRLGLSQGSVGSASRMSF